MTNQEPFAHGSERVRAVPRARWISRNRNINLAEIRGSGPDGTVLVRDLEQMNQTESAILPDSKSRASSLARRMAERKGIALDSITGTGTRGRIMLRDLEERGDKPVIPAAEPAQIALGRTLPMAQMRKVIARRMSQSAQTAPHIYFFTDVEMDPIDQLRTQVQPEFEKQFQVRLSLNDFLIKATALVIKEYPLLNAVVRQEAIEIMPEINIGLAVALEDGLIVPALPGADRLGLGEIARMRMDLVSRARTGKLKLEEIERGTFTISSLAQFEIVFFTAILNQPQSGILSVGKTCDQLALKEGQVIAKRIARIGLAVDHRIIDGAVAAAFLQTLKARMESPTFTFLHL